MSGNDGHADVQCIVQACEYSADLLFVWDGQLDERKRNLRRQRVASRRSRMAWAQARSEGVVHGAGRPLAETRSTVPRAVVPVPERLQERSSATRPHGSVVVAQHRKLLVAQQTPATDVSPLSFARHRAAPSTPGSSSGALPQPLDVVSVRERATNKFEALLGTVGEASEVGDPDDDHMAVPKCERGDWRATGPGPVQLAMKDNLVVFGAAGCAEVHYLDKNLVHIYMYVCMYIYYVHIYIRMFA